MFQKIPLSIVAWTSLIQALLIDSGIVLVEIICSGKPNFKLNLFERLNILVTLVCLSSCAGLSEAM